MKEPRVAGERRAARRFWDLSHNRRAFLIPRKRADLAGPFRRGKQARKRPAGGGPARNNAGGKRQDEAVANLRRFRRLTANLQGKRTRQCQKTGLQTQADIRTKAPRHPPRQRHHNRRAARKQNLQRVPLQRRVKTGKHNLPPPPRRTRPVQRRQNRPRRKTTRTEKPRQRTAQNRRVAQNPCRGRPLRESDAENFQNHKI